MTPYNDGNRATFQHSDAAHTSIFITSGNDISGCSHPKISPSPELQSETSSGNTSPDRSPTSTVQTTPELPPRPHALLCEEELIHKSVIELQVVESRQLGASVAKDSTGNTGTMSRKEFFAPFFHIYDVWTPYILSSRTEGASRLIQQLSIKSLLLTRGFVLS
jgi:hypothetical protein